MGRNLQATQNRGDLPYREILKQIQAGIGLIDPYNQILDVNPAFADLLSYSPTEMLHQSILGFIKSDQQNFLKNKLKFVNNGDDFFMPITFIRKNGQMVDAIISFSGIISEIGEYWGAAFFVIDIDQDRFFQAVLDGRDLHQRHALAGLNRVMAEISRSWELEKLLTLVFSSVKEYTGFDGGGFFVYKSENPTLFVYPQGGFIALPLNLVKEFRKIRSQYSDLLKSDVIVLSKMNPTPEHVFLHQKFFSLVNPGAEPPDAVRAYSYKDNQRTNGIFVFYHQSESGFTAEMLGMADIVTSHAAIAIENMYLIQDKEILAAEKERLRLSRDLHDSVAQGLYSLMLYGEASRRALLANKTEVVAENLGEMIQLSREAMRDLRLLIFELRPPLIREIGFTGAIVARLESVEKRSGTHADCNIYGESNLTSESEDELYWIAHEALNNVLKHAKANNMCVDIHFSSTSTLVIIQDDGVGFDPGTTGSSSGVGLKSMAERVARLGGKLKVDSEIGLGTTVEIRIDNK